MRVKMRKLVFMLFVCLVLHSVLVDQQTMLTKARESFPASQAPADWHAYKLSDDEFSVLLPTVPGMSSYRVSRGPSSQSILRHVIGTYAEGVAYVIYVFERRQSLDDFIANFRYSSASNFERNLEVGKVSGKAYGFKNNERSGSTYFLVSKGRIYVFEAQGSLLGNPDIGIPRFLGSIRFGKDLEGQMLADGPGAQPSSQLPTSAPINAGPPMSGGVIELNAGPPMSGKLVSLKPVVVAKPEPTYTEEARRHQITGTIVIRCIFSSSGAITNIVPLSKLSDGLTEKAIAAAQQIRFIPAIKDGKFVSMYMQLEYNFNLY